MRLEFLSLAAAIKIEFALTGLSNGAAAPFMTSYLVTSDSDKTAVLEACSRVNLGTCREFVVDPGALRPLWQRRRTRRRYS